MTKLNCSVTNCQNNTTGCCTLNGIMVNGQNACSCNDTCCTSFAQDTASATNATVGSKAPVEQMVIDCSANECMHNSSNKCIATNIKIDGAGANSCDGTKCESFQKG